MAGFRSRNPQRKLDRNRPDLGRCRRSPHHGEARNQRNGQPGEWEEPRCGITRIEYDGQGRIASATFSDFTDSDAKNALERKEKVRIDHSKKGVLRLDEDFDPDTCEYNDDGTLRREISSGDHNGTTEIRYVWSDGDMM